MAAPIRHKRLVSEAVEAYGRGQISAEELIERVAEIDPGFQEHLRFMLELEGALAPLERDAAAVERRLG